MEKRFWEFDQNNSGGCYLTDGNVAAIVIVEAYSEEEAIKIGLDNGIYFNGVDEGFDCECCGDRWYYPRELKDFRSFGRYDSEVVKKAQSKYGGIIEKSGNYFTLYASNVLDYAKSKIDFTFRNSYSIIFKDGTILKEVDE